MDAVSVAALLAVFGRDTELGSRNYAIVLLLARLGLRAGEAAGLTLADVNWRAGTIVIHGKGSRRDELPLATPARRSPVTCGPGRRGMPAGRCSRLPAHRAMP
jgi:integrase/recombinase XerD